ncbi:MAG TPA: hypothetical protein P5119_01335 [Candidatus Aminicenantes bacterium]|nr:hypothetical protein [Candidatus Aminicenantes bacterium]HRY63968.1 hypothetical protein [Candidatus Aminicenantes bacterium]HRZ70881.1 hypothetical protein [Candidatus Aminicenantes bacterium]
MKKVPISAVVLAFLAALFFGRAYAQQPAGAGTGDKKFDAQLKALNEEARSDPEGFIRRLSQRHNIPEEEIRQAKEKNGLDEADAYMATALARRAKRPVSDVAAEYRRNRDQGWGAMARNMGIKPGSPEFKQLKADAKIHTSYMKGQAKARQKREKEMEKHKGKGPDKGRNK